MAKEIKISVSSLGVNVEANAEIKEPIEVINILSIAIGVVQQEMIKKAQLISPVFGVNPPGRKLN